MVTGSLTFAAWDWLWPAVGAVALGAMLLAWSYRAARIGALRWVCLGLKLLGIATLAFCLLEPLWFTQRVRPGANLFAIVADNSQSLQVRDRGGSATRAETLAALLDTAGGGWQALLEDQFEVRRFLFDTRLRPTRDFADAAFDGLASGLGGALRGVRERFQSRPMAGVLLLTDGNATDLPELPADLDSYPAVYPVVIGQADAVRDLSVAPVQVSQTAFEDAPVSLQADVMATGMSGENLVAELLDGSGRRVEAKTLRVRREGETLAFRFQLRPEKPGVSFYQVQVRTQDEAGQPAGITNSTEGTLLNNRRAVAVDRGRGPHRVLYVAGRPNWEYKFLNRAVLADDQIQLVGLIRIALREPKFDFRGRAGETGNPLFRGFGNQSREETERYDQPVLRRLNTRDELELRTGFPRTPEELYAYDAVILDDVEAAFFTPDQMSLLQKFVGDRGGGFLMLGGAESFREGRYQRTPIGDLLPVYLDRGEPAKPAAAWRLNLAREGWLQPWARLRETERDEKTRLEGMPPFQVFNAVEEVKPGASVVATAKDESGAERPALIIQRFGRGRTAALTVGDVWRWGMQNAEARSDLDKSWRQLIRWLVADVPASVELTVNPAAEVGPGAVQLQVRVRDARFEPLDAAWVTIEVQPALAGDVGFATNSVQLRAEPSLREAGLYEAAYLPRAAGGYRAAVTVTDPFGAEVGRAEAGWSADPGAVEFQSLKPNLALLEAIARRTGGEVIAAGELAALARRLPNRQAPIMETSSRPAWHTPWLFGFALVCLVAEWGLRRWKGLP